MKYLSLLLAVLLSGCATYKTAEKVTLVSFDDNPVKGQSIGNIRGEDCTWFVLGYNLGGQPTVDRAFMNARKGIDGGLEAAGLTKSKNQDMIRYVNNVNTDRDGFNAANLFGKNCIVVTGVGYK